MSDWLYQVRIRVSETLSESLRSGKHTDLAGKLDEIASRCVPMMRFKVTVMKLKKMVSRNMLFTNGQSPLSKIQKKRQNI